jgi:hypothetical protein
MSLPANAIEITRLLELVRRQLADASVPGLSWDGSFEHSYSAALTLATVVVRAHDERIHGQDHHRLTFERFGQLAAGRWAQTADYLQHCRRRRNTSAYVVAGTISNAESAELLKAATQLRDEVIAWLRRERPGLHPA